VFSNDLKLLLIGVVVVGILIFVGILLTNKRGTKFDQEAYQSAFLKIENTLDQTNVLSYNTVVIDADKLLDKALVEMGVPGRTMGDRLKKSGGKFSQLNAVWYAHKLRNQIAHEHGFRLEYAQAQHALKTFRQALKDVGAV
jgi:hypothetical protein